MADLLPSTPDADVGDGGDPRVIGVDSDDAEALLSALQSETAREILAALYEDPGTPSDLAERAGTSIQNVRYHLEKLVDADLVEVADTVYSEKGREMKVYAPVSGPLVLLAGDDDGGPALESALSRLLGALGVLGVSSLAVQGYFGRNGGLSEFVPSMGSSGGVAQQTATESGDPDVVYDGQNASAPTKSESGGPNGDSGGSATTADASRTTAEEATQTTQAAGDATQTAQTGATKTAEATRTQAAQTTEAMRTTEAMTETTMETVADATRTLAETTTALDSGGAAAAGVPPGLLFFAGGLVVLLALVAAVYLRDS